MDRGLSGFSGENLAAGVLGEFVRQARAGKIAKGSVLIVENPDRISRQKFATAYARFYQPVLEAGIEIHFVSLRCVLKPNHSFVDLSQVGVDMDRANSESAAKSERVEKAWAVKKHSSPPGIVITGVMPAWLKGKVGEPIRVHERRAETVRLIFKMAAGGMGKRLITRRLNEKKIPTFGAEHWAHSTVQKILFNRAVLGEYQPMKGRPGRKGNGTKINGESLKRVPDGPPRLGFFPVIVSLHLWDKAHASMSARRAVNERGQVIPNSGGQRGGIHNLFAGLVSDGNMGFPMHWQDKGKRSRPKLATASKDVNGRTPNTIVYADFEAAFLTWLDQLDWSSVIDTADSEEIRRYEEQIAELKAGIEADTRKIETIIDALIDLPSSALKARLRAIETAVASHISELSVMETKLTEAKTKHRDLLNANVVYRTLSKAKSLETRARLRAEIARKIARITFWFHRDENTPKLVPDPKDDLFPFAKVTFTNGRERYVVWFNNGFMTLERPKGYFPKQA